MEPHSVQARALLQQVLAFLMYKLSISASLMLALCCRLQKTCKTGADNLPLMWLRSRLLPALNAIPESMGVDLGPAPCPPPAAPAAAAQQPAVVSLCSRIHATLLWYKGEHDL